MRVDERSYERAYRKWQLRNAVQTAVEKSNWKVATESGQMESDR